MRRDNAPVGYTCSAIDKVISRMEDSISYARECNEERADDVIYELENAIIEMEDLRTNNSDLREWGNELHSEVEKLKNEIATLESKCDDRDYEISELETRLNYCE